MDEWKYRAWLFQQGIFRILGSRKWDDLNGEKKNLLDKLDAAFGLCFGPDYNNNEKVKKVFENVVTEAVKLFDDQHYREHFSCTFIDWRNLDGDNAGRFFVIWLQNSKGSEICLDLNGRSYESWEEFLDNNVLPKCYIIYPKSGRYSYGCLKDDFIDVEFEESRACSFMASVKTTLDVVTTIGGIVSAGVLIFNPVSASVLIGAVTVSVLTGSYNVGNSISRIYDIHKHDGGLAINSKTCFAFGELALSTVSTVAVGASAGMKAVSSASALTEGTLAYRLANNVSQITKFVSGANAGFYVLVVIDKYIREGELMESDLINLVKTIFFSLNIIVSERLLYSAVRYLADSFSIDRIIHYCMSSQNMVFTSVRRVISFISANEIDTLIKKIFPDFKVCIERISNFGPLIQRTSTIVDRTCSALVSKNFDLDYIYFLQKELTFLWNDFLSYKEDSKIAIHKNFDKETWDCISKWTKHDAIDVPKFLVEKVESRFDDKINTPVEMKKKVKETIQTIFGHIDSPPQLEQREKKLYSELLNLIGKHEMRDNEYVLNKISFYCTFFNSLYSKLMESYHYEHFTYRIKENKDMIKDNFFTNFYSVRNIHENCYSTAMKLLKENIQKFHEKFDNNFNSTEDKHTNRQIFDINIPCFSSELTEDVFYEKAKSLIPRLEMKLNKHCTTFDNFDCMSIIKSKENDFVLFFYTVLENDHATGILLLVEDMVD